MQNLQKSLFPVGSEKHSEKINMDYFDAEKTVFSKEYCYQNEEEKTLTLVSTSDQNMKGNARFTLEEQGLPICSTTLNDMTNRLLMQDILYQVQLSSTETRVR